MNFFGTKPVVHCPALRNARRSPPGVECRLDPHWRLVQVDRLALAGFVQQNPDGLAVAA
jgi:hypothetical protein